ncbi:SLC13 family permease [Paremcibacter congregatus]|uniref:SLC13 family permease n=1 Tax=Paremcibacter congregatus TaxID=2043170 RepID=A0A2G4YN23_9PROT|nr:SLC13 family permease [Paremcibacter congregatus]PHZ83724.1 SLC13 family permease [Paremcibacter congregatus]QDE27425.1 TRAP transporter large permease subunit [Paremcibacter congregatus]
MELVQSSVQMWATFAVILVAIVFYAWDRISMEVTSLGTISLLLLIFHFIPVYDAQGTNILDLTVLLAGFADPALITILALLVIGQGMVQTGALETPAQIIVKHGIAYPRRVILACLITVMVISALLNNTPVVVIFIPIMITLMDKMDKSAGLVLMPLSFVAILGGMTTLIGSSTNLLVAGSYKSQTGIDIGFFDFTIPGLFLAGLGLIYVMFIAPLILPKKLSSTEETQVITGKQFIVQLDLVEGNSLIGKKSVAGMFPDLTRMTVRLVQRGRKSFLPPFDDITFQEGDSIILATTRAILTEKLSKNPDLLKGILTDPESSDENTVTEVSRGQKIAEVIIAPASRLDGRTLEQVGYHLQGGCKVLGIQRRSRMIRSSMNDIRLEAGDILLVVGTSAQINALRMNKDVMLMEWSTREVPILSDSWKALGIFSGVVAFASTGIVPIPITATCGAFLMIALGCLNIRQASRAVDRRIFLLIGAALAMGASLQATGGANYLADRMVHLLDGASVAVTLSAFFLLVALLTNMLSNNATAVLFTPIAINMATKLGVDPMIFVTAVIFAANCSFATPMGYQTNLLVMGPGNYKFNDFLKVGVPLILILWIGYSFFAPWYYGF